MQLARLHLENFKGIKALDIDFRQAAGEAARPLTLLLGDNGSGKTTVLQAIALILSLATRRTLNLTSFQWPGFLGERIGSLGSTRVELEVLFDPEEIETTRSLFSVWSTTSTSIDAFLYPDIVEPSQLPAVTLVLEDAELTSPSGPAALAQFLGRFFIRACVRSRPDLRKHFPLVGDVFWFDQNRNLFSADKAPDGAENASPVARPESSGIDRLRDFLVGWWAYHTSEAPRSMRGTDYLARLEERMSELFPGLRFIGVAPREYARASRATDSYFLIERGGKVYDLAEMSSGEQAIFPLLYEFVRLDIARSIILIDELELHLHPPEQQALLTALRRIGPDCQFIITSHSPYLESITPAENEVRLPGGRPCL